MKTNQELRVFINDAYERASKINHFSSFIDWSDKNELIRNAKYYRKLIIQKDYSLVKKINCKDEDTGELVWISLKKDYSLRELILILVAENFYMTRQQIRKFITNHKSAL